MKLKNEQLFSIEPSIVSISLWVTTQYMWRRSKRCSARKCPKAIKKRAVFCLQALSYIVHILAPALFLLFSLFLQKFSTRLAYPEFCFLFNFYSVMRYCMYSFSGNSRNKTFGRHKSPQDGSRQVQLIERANATLGSGKLGDEFKLPKWRN